MTVNKAISATSQEMWDPTANLAAIECLHGGDDRGETGYGMTIFPQPIALAAAFDTIMLNEIATIIGLEMRAVSNLYRTADGTAR